MTPQDERNYVRELATHYMELCDSDHNKQTIEAWRSLNNLQSKRTMINCNIHMLDQEIAMELPEQRVQDPILRRAERRFQRMFWEATIGDDRVFYPWYEVGAKMFRHPEGVWGVVPNKVEDSSSRGWRHMPVLVESGDLERLKPTEHKVLDPKPPQVAVLEDTFGDIIPISVKKSTMYPLWGGVDLSEAAGAMFGLEELLFALYEKPGMVHEFMAFTRDAVLANLKQGEAVGDWRTADSWYYLTPSHCDDLPDPSPEHGATLKDLAYFTHAQEFEGVGPAQFEEFLLDYQLPIIELFGRITYGCCETLDTKLDVIKKIPNLTKVVSGPRSDPGKYPDAFGEQCVISWRPVATAVAAETFDETYQRNQLRQGLTALKGCQVEVHLHEPMTVQSDLSRVRTWVKIAREEAERIGD